MIPSADVRHPILADEVVAEVAAGEFHVRAAETIDDGIEADDRGGARRRDGGFGEREGGLAQRACRLGVPPQTVLAAYRVGDSPTNVVTPLMPQFPLMVVFARRYQRDAGIGTVIALMLTYTFVATVAWTLFFVAWYAIGIPFGPGWPVR